MTTMRSVDPPAGLDALLARLLPFLNGTEPRPGERGADRNGRIYVWQPSPDGGGWTPDLPWWGTLPGLAAKAEAHWQAQAEPEAG
jgi:hypothetical protein